MVAASQHLHLSQPAISSQIHTLQEALGVKLFARSGRGLVMTDAGRLVYRYADGIFALGDELRGHLTGIPGPLAARLVVGVAQSMPKLVAFRLLQPALRLDHPVRLECREDTPDRLLADLSLHALDLVLADQPLATTGNVHAFNHLLGESRLFFFAQPALADRLRPQFPRSLDGAPMLLPGRHTALRYTLESWLEFKQIKPQIVGEFDDSALLKVFGEHGAGVFVAPTIVEREIRAQYGVTPLGHVDELTERFYAITVDRRIRHSGVAAITAAARAIFATQSS